MTKTLCNHLQPLKVSKTTLQEPMENNNLNLFQITCFTFAIFAIILCTVVSLFPVPVFLANVAAIAFSLAFAIQEWTARRISTFYIFLSVNVIPGIIAVIAQLFFDWRTYAIYEMDRDFAANALYILFALQCLWIIAFPFFIKTDRVRTVPLILALIASHLISGVFAAISIHKIFI